jgi:hypothetical protein
MFCNTDIDTTECAGFGNKAATLLCNITEAGGVTHEISTAQHATNLRIIF